MREWSCPQGDEGAPRAGLPRPRLDGMPVPWITRVGPDGPLCKRVLLDRILRCQAEWRCQVCGEPLPRRAWVSLGSDGTVYSDAAMHKGCLILARRWCPYLRNPANDVEIVEVDQAYVYADGERLDLIVDYGDETKPWAVAHSTADQI